MEKKKIAAHDPEKKVISLNIQRADRNQWHRDYISHLSNGQKSRGESHSQTPLHRQNKIVPK